jgi:hypothetical protein
MSPHCQFFQSHISCFMFSQTGPRGGDNEKKECIERHFRRVLDDTWKEWGRSIQLKDWGYIFLLNFFWKPVLPKSTSAKARPLCLTMKPEQVELRNVFLYRFRKPRLFVSSVSCYCHVTQNHSWWVMFFFFCIQFMRHDGLHSDSVFTLYCSIPPVYTGLCTTISNTRKLCIFPQNIFVFFVWFSH